MIALKTFSLPIHLGLAMNAKCVYIYQSDFSLYVTVWFCNALVNIYNRPLTCLQLVINQLQDHYKTTAFSRSCKILNLIYVLALHISLLITC